MNTKTGAALHAIHEPPDPAEPAQGSARVDEDSDDVKLLAGAVSNPSEGRQAREHGAVVGRQDEGARLVEHQQA